MEIKTLAEVRAGNVTVTVTTTEPEGCDPEQDAEVLAGNYARARQRITELEEQLDRTQDALIKVRGEREQLENKVKGYDLDRHTERDRADQAERRITELEEQLDKATKGHVCTEQCTPDKHVAFIGRHRLTEVELELSERRADVRRLTEELNKRFTFQQVEDAKVNARASEGARIRSEIRGLLNRPGIEQRMSMEQSPGAQELAHVIRQVRQLLDNPA